jgi:hypothetical protein
MVRLNEIRRNEVSIDPPSSNDAGLVFIGVIHRFGGNTPS